MTRKLPVLLVAGLVTLSVVAVLPVSAAGTTDVSLDPSSTTVDAGQTVTVDVVVESADGGVGAYEIAVASGNTTVAGITDVSVAGNPADVQSSTAADGSSVTVQTFGMDTADAGAVTLATITVETRNPGELDLNLTVDALADEAANKYTRSAVNDATLTVEGASSLETDVAFDPASDSVTVGNSTTYDLVVESANGGVGAFNATVTSSNATAATITDVSVAGSPAVVESSTTADGGSATVRTFGMDTADVGSATVVSVTVTGQNVGTADLAATFSALSTENGESYTVNGSAGATLTVSDGTIELGEVAVRLVPQNGDGSVPTGGTATYDVVADLTGSVGAYDFNVSVDDTSVVTIDSYALGGNPGVDESGITSDGSTLYVSAALASFDGNGPHTLATVNVSGQATGETTLDLRVDQVGTENGNAYDVVLTEDAVANVSSMGPGDLNGNGDAATDPDGDGQYEDVNGDGSANILDVQALFSAYSDVDASQEAAVDFNGDGSVNVLDVQALFDQV